MSLRVHHGALVVRNGFTHYRQQVEEHRFFRGDRNLPSRIIVLDGSGNLSFDALSWLSEQNVPLIRINWRGEVVIAVGIGNARNPAGRHPIPRDWHFVGNATHPVNSILNYGYSILESQIRIQLVAAGLDPTIGVLHSGRRGRSDFVLDLMEPLRPIIDRCLNSCRHRRFNRRIS